MYANWHLSADNTPFSFRFVCATPARNIQVGRPRRLRSYHVRSNPGYEGCTIWEAARATTAAPTYFKSISIGPDNARKEDFIDGGVGCNNPIQQILDEVRAAFGAERFVSCVISIGTGIPKVTDLKKSTTLTKIIPINAINALAKVATECQNASREVGNRFKDVPDFYFRFNVEQGLQDTEMDEWENQNDVVVHTRAYLLDASESVDKAVKALHARPRRLKASDIGA